MKTASPSTLVNLRDPQQLAARRPLLIAHRGGVIAPHAPENSLAAIHVAALHGYDMVELDVVAAKDQEPVLFHDRRGHLLVNCGMDAFVHDLTSSELIQLQYRASDQPIATLAQALACCAAQHLGVMLDIKPPSQPPHSTAFFRRIGVLLEEYHLTSATLTFADHALAQAYLTDKALFAISAQSCHQLLHKPALPADGQWWFAPPHEVSPDMLHALGEHGVLVIPYINTVAYPPHAHYELAREDVRRLSALRVDGFQIDSVYEDYFEHIKLTHTGGHGHERESEAQQPQL